jgi:16S rRNA (adenine1518-N6/adenine1519-N6)-dimethyltransferase
MFRPKRIFSQNFLIDQNIAQKIVQSAELKKGDIAWEIGSGKGILTDKLIKTEAKLTCFEIDRELCEYLTEQFQRKITLMEGDVLEADWNKIIKELPTGEKITLVANIPYNITSPLLYKLADHFHAFRRIILMIQKEVEEKLTSKPREIGYGYLALRVNYYFNIKKLIKVPAHLFSPQPKVDSVVIALEPKDDREQLVDERLFWTIVKAAFQTRRKTLKNSLSSVLNKKEIDLLEQQLKLQNDSGKPINFDLSARGETLYEKDFLTIYRIVLDIRNS